jgi:hypothetical protein
MALGSGIRKKPIPDPGSRSQGFKKAPDPGSRSATLIKITIRDKHLGSATLLFFQFPRNGVQYPTTNTFLDP